jgi:hypothetical protein
LFDNNLSPYLAKAIGALCASEELEVVHKRQKFRGDTPDVDWIRSLGNEGGWAVITEDRLTRNPLEKEALRRSGLTTFILASGWARLTFWDQAWHLVRWWPRIVTQAGLVHGGVFVVPVKFSGKGKFKPIRL